MVYLIIDIDRMNIFVKAILVIVILLIFVVCLALSLLWYGAIAAVVVWFTITVLQVLGYA